MLIDYKTVNLIVLFNIKMESIKEYEKIKGMTRSNNMR
jgi:hypothetical protein